MLVLLSVMMLCVHGAECDDAVLLSACCECCADCAGLIVCCWLSAAWVLSVMMLCVHGLSVMMLCGCADCCMLAE